MAKLSSKHSNMERLSFADFSGGLNLITPAETLEMNEMQEATNFEFSPDAGLFKVRGGIASVFTFDAPVTDIFPVAGTGVAIVRAGAKLYRLVNQEVAFIGDIKGDLGGSFEYWGEQGQVVMAFGGPVYVYDANTDVLAEVISEGAPQNVNTVYYRAGRIAVVVSGSDIIRYSGVGDPHMWVEDPDDDSTSKQVEVGYMDGCDINAVGEFSGELIVFKSPVGQPEQGRIYRLQNEFPNWAIQLYSKGISAWSSRAVTTLGDELLFITKDGVASLATTAAYGNFLLNWPGLKINPRFSHALDTNCRVWQLTHRNQVWFADCNSSEIYVYHYKIGQGAWTKLEMPGIVKAVALVSGKVLIGINNTVYELNDILNRDTVILADGSGAEQDILAYWTPKTVVRRNQLLTKMIMVNYFATTPSAELVVERLRVQLPPNDDNFGDIAFTDDNIALLDTDPLFESKTAIVRKRVQFVRWNITPRLEIVNGQFSVSSIVFEIAEV
jgi:hypothetical protein